MYINVDISLFTRVAPRGYNEGNEKPKEQRK